MRLKTLKLLTQTSHLLIPLSNVARRCKRTLTDGKPTSKKARAEGCGYKTKSGKMKSSRKTGPPCNCRKKCFEKVNEEEREHLLLQFNHIDRKKTFKEEEAQNIKDRERKYGLQSKKVSLKAQLDRLMALSQAGAHVGGKLTYVFPPSLKSVGREIIPGRLVDRPDPTHKM